MASIYVTDKKIPIPEKLYRKIQIIMKRVTQKKPILDAQFNIDGEEGIGKTTFAALVAYIVHYETGRPFSEKNFFFDTEKAINFAKTTKEQIIVFDEPASDLLSNEWWNLMQQNLIKLLMMARKKRHFIIFNFARFYKFKDYVAYERARCLVHLYCRSNESSTRFMYIKRKYLETLYTDCRIKKKKTYSKFGKFSRCNGTLPDVFDESKDYNILDHFNYADYDAEKDKAIESINENKKKNANEYFKLKYAVSHLTCPIKTRAELATQLGIHPKTLIEWKNITETKQKQTNTQENEVVVGTITN